MDTAIEKGGLKEALESRNEDLGERPEAFHANAALDPAIERRVLRKCDTHVLPILGLLFLVAFVDRINIGNAKIQGLEASLHMQGTDYNIALFAFYIPYCLLDLPSNLVLRRLQLAPTMSAMMLGWGVATLGQGLTRTYGGLVAARACMGVCEAGFVPGCAYLIGQYYRRHEFLKRYAAFFSMSILAGAFGGFLAYLLQKLDGAARLEGWRWIFIIEGVLTCLIAGAAFFLIVPWPRDAKFLSVEEKVVLLRRLEQDTPVGGVDRGSWAAFYACLTDWKILLCALAYFGALNTASSFAAFQPTLVQALGYQPADAQVLTIPVYMFALVCTLATSYASDRLAHRYAFCMLGVAATTVGWVLQLAPGLPAGVRYFSLYLTLAGAYVLMPTLVVWLSNNMGGSYRRNLATGVQIGFGNLANFVSSNVFLPSQAPAYRTAYSVGLGLQLMAGLACTLVVWGLWRENRRRNREGAAARDDYTVEEIAKIGDGHPAFRYTL